MVSRRRFMGGSLMLGTLTSLPQWVRAETPIMGGTSDSVKIGVYSNTIFFLPMWIAQQRGYFKEAGISLELEQVQSMHQMVDELLTGTRPVAMLGPEVAFLDRPGADRVSIIAGNANRPPHFLIAQPRFKRLNDLRGATFGVISLTEGTTYLVQKMAAAAGLGRDDYKIKAVGSAPARVKLLDEGAIDAALQPFPLSYAAEEKGFSNLGWVGQSAPDWQFSVVLANRKWLSTNGDFARRMMMAAQRGLRSMFDYPEAAAEIAAAHMRTSLAYARRAIGDVDRLDIMDRNFMWSESALKAVFDMQQRSGALDVSRKFVLADYVDFGVLGGTRTEAIN